LLRLVRFYRLRKLENQAEDLLSLSVVLHGFFKLIRLFIYILLLAHWGACIWYSIGLGNVERGEASWLVEYFDMRWDE